MLVAIICQLIVATIASPYQKYPFVFLLDVGNEELAKTNTEKIRVSIPGGSLAVRYPAISEGDLITHVRVSSIDFGSDLKASILDGGPGYKYVVLVFLGNPGVKCDAVIILQTLPNNQDSSNNDQGTIDSWGVNSISDSAINNSVEDMSNENKEAIKSNKEADLTEQSSNVHNNAQLSNGDDESGDNSEEIKDELDDEENGQSIQDKVSNENESNEQIDDKIEKQDSSNDSDDSEDDDDDHAERLQGYQSKYNSNELESETINDKSLDQDSGMYIKDSIYDAQVHNPANEDQMITDEEVYNDSDKFKDSNNNNFDSEYGAAVA
ncbi:hypothetical protein RR48_08370 [Papilio machaon]|uniref:Replicase polyprotein 1a n=1 Tax=Papilio machaon TaxID=76193 RepID=A0A194R1F6_PAPMA|nr:hypothetical protein RR48_08370 [Papilio machaon]